MPETPLERTLRVGRIDRAERFEKARKPELFKLWIDLGDEDVQSAAQLGYNYEPDELVGRQVLCVTDLGSVNIAGFVSEVLVVGVPDEEEHPVLVTPDETVPEGGLLY